MVRLSDAFPSGPETTRPTRKEEPPPSVSLPEILILSDDTVMVDLIRSAIEDRGYRIRYFPTPAELQVRLKVAGRVVIMVDGRIEEAGSFLRDIATSDYPDRIVILPDAEQKGLFDGVPNLRLHSLPISAEDLIDTIEELSTAPVTRPGTDKSNLFSSRCSPGPLNLKRFLIQYLLHPLQIFLNQPIRYRNLSILLSLNPKSTNRLPGASM